MGNEENFAPIHYASFNVTNNFNKLLVTNTFLFYLRIFTYLTFLSVVNSTIPDSKANNV